MSGKTASFFLVIMLALLGGVFLSGFETDLAEADVLVTPTLNASAWNYLPVVHGQTKGPTTTPLPPIPTRTPFPSLTPTSTQTPTIANTPANTAEAPTATPTNTPTATSPPETADTGDVRITEILFDGAVPNVESDEYVEIRNYDNRIIQLIGWKLHDEGVKHTYTFPTYAMQPGEVCRIYTNENHPEWCGLNWGNGNAIWNNDGDEATLKDSSGVVIDICSYSGSGTKVDCG